MHISGSTTLERGCLDILAKSMHMSTDVNKSPTITIAAENLSYDTSGLTTPLYLTSGSITGSAGGFTIMCYPSSGSMYIDNIEYWMNILKW